MRSQSDQISWLSDEHNISITGCVLWPRRGAEVSCGFIQMWDLLHPHNGQECDQCSSVRREIRVIADTLICPGHTGERALVVTNIILSSSSPGPVLGEIRVIANTLISPAHRERALVITSIIFHLMTVYWMPNFCFIWVYYFWLSQLFTADFASDCYQPGWQMNVQIKSVWIKCFSRVLLVFIAFYNNTLSAKLFSKSYLAHI